MSFEELDHTADFLFRCRGKTLNELFSEAASAMFSVMFGSDVKSCLIKKEITLSSDSPENLLVDFLSELLFVFEIDDIAFSRADVDIRDNSLSAVVYGEEFNISRHSGGTEIKGISRSGLKLVKSDNMYQTDIIFDV
ncbi:SHS2 domain-containing protein [Methanomicrobium sp. W14]|uniref:archease n=1 Tax=Methanomicrobium sp. W14 TaxID=2817839 RepID=UPI001AE65128|nr:archease [Methanomicrobium sp. W14]MBP2132798.1 SHS2 domain-containing protein [Methanomicrobium sp. W14]